MRRADPETNTGSGSSFAAFRYPDYRRVFATTVVWQTGSWLQNTARAFLVYDITGSKSALGAIYFFSVIPQLVFSQISGVLADRFDRRRLVIGSQAVATLLTLVVGYLAQSGAGNLWNLSAISFVAGTCEAMAGPARGAIVPTLVQRKDLSSAISLQSMANSGTRIFGPGLAGALLPIVGVASLFYITAAAFGLALVVWWTLRLPPSPRSADRHAGRAVVESVRYARRTPAIAMALLVAAVIGGLGLCYLPLLAPYCTDLLAHGNNARGAHLYGLIEGALGVGSVMGAVLLPRVARRLGTLTLAAGTLCFGVVLTVFGAWAKPWPATVVAVLIGALQFGTGAYAQMVILKSSPGEMHGRLVSLYTMAFSGLFPIFSLAVGAMADAVGLTPVLVGVGVTCAILGLVPAARRSALQPVADGAEDAAGDADASESGRTT